MAATTLGDNYNFDLGSTYIPGIQSGDGSGSSSYTFSNGIYDDNDVIKLGGTLIEDTTISIPTTHESIDYNFIVESEDTITGLYIGEDLSNRIVKLYNDGGVILIGYTGAAPCYIDMGGANNDITLESTTININSLTNGAGSIINLTASDNSGLEASVNLTATDTTGTSTISLDHQGITINGDTLPNGVNIYSDTTINMGIYGVNYFSLSTTSMGYNDYRTTKLGIQYFSYDEADWVASTLVTKGYVDNSFGDTYTYVDISYDTNELNLRGGNSLDYSNLQFSTTDFLINSVGVSNGIIIKSDTSLSLGYNIGGSLSYYLEFDNAYCTFYDNRTITRGIEYYNHNEANWSNNTLVTKSYVDDSFGNTNTYVDISPSTNELDIRASNGSDYSRLEFSETDCILSTVGISNGMVIKSDNYLVIGYNIGGTANNYLSFDETLCTFNDSRTVKLGIQYYNYTEGDWTDDTLVTKGYVDALVASYHP